MPLLVRSAPTASVMQSNQHIPSVSAAIANKSFDQIAAICETHEIEAADLDACGDSLYSFQILGHLYNDDLNDARFCWKRVPESRRGGQELGAVFPLLEALWRNDYKAFYAAAAAVQWPGDLGPLVLALRARVAAKAERLVEKAYTSIAIEEYEALTGQKPGKGWDVDATNKFLVRSADANRGVQEAAAFSDATLGEITKYVVALDDT